MGFCFMTGKKAYGRWVFSKCDGRKTFCVVENAQYTPGNGPYPEQSRNKDCIEYTVDYQTAVELLEQWYKQHNDEDCLDCKRIEECVGPCLYDRERGDQMHYVEEIQRKAGEYNLLKHKLTVLKLELINMASKHNLLDDLFVQMEW